MIRAFLVTFFIALCSIAAHAQLSTADCLGCHDKVDAKKFETSIHGSLGCTDCHSDVTAAPHETAPKPVDCAGCHPDAVAAWNNSLHAKGVKSGVKGAARCADCHGIAHEILPSTDKLSPTFHANVPKTCSRCHAEKFLMEKAGLNAQAAISYQESLHGRLAARGSTKAAVCTDCHDYHAIRPPNDPLSGIFKFNVGHTCGKCHAAIAAQYADGVHGKALAHGNWNAPVCTDCHGIHTIAKASDAVRGPRASCAHCHEGVRLTQEFAVPANRVTSYESSYHGLAHTLGSKVAADCASCHGAHDVLPSSNPRSMVNRNNLPKTCGKCHPGASANFARGKIHLVKGDVSDTPAKALVWIRWIYMVLIIGTIGFMALHNALVWFKKAQAKRRMPNRNVVRMNQNQRLQHVILVISFTVLVISGFALAWPTSLFARVFGPSETLRQTIHRGAAVVMIVLGLYHMAYMMFTREGRKGLRDFMLRPHDVTDIIAVFRYYLGMSSKRPEFPRFGYAEKMEYWAGLWGTIVMAVTGLVIWYAVAVATWVPRWWVDIATAIHFYEAILATLAILVWHLYHVIFDPDVYPMNWAWYDGKMSDELYKHEHGLDTNPPKSEEETHL